MPTITVKDLPGKLHQRLKQQAGQHHRSLNREIVACLEASLHSAKVDVDRLLVRARELRGNIAGALTDETLRQLKHTGRA
jgi:plasmid stability protein